jgi:hypothetical protein
MKLTREHQAAAHRKPCSNKITFDGSSPKYELSAKNVSVAERVGPLVITYQGMMTDPFAFPNSVSATVCSLAILSAWYWNRDLCEGSPMS